MYCLVYIHVQHKYTRINIWFFLRIIICMPNINLQWCHWFLYILYIHVQHKSTRIIYVYNPYASLYYLVFDIHPCPTWIYENQYMSIILMLCCIIWYLIHIHVQHKSTRIIYVLNPYQYIHGHYKSTMMPYISLYPIYPCLT